MGGMMSFIAPLMSVFSSFMGGGEQGGGAMQAQPMPTPVAPTVDNSAEIAAAKKAEQQQRVKAAGYGSLDQTNGTLGGEDPNAVKKPTLLGG